MFVCVSACVFVGVYEMVCVCACPHVRLLVAAVCGGEEIGEDMCVCVCVCVCVGMRV